MRRGLGRKIEWIVVAAVILSCGGLLWWPMLTADVKPWEQGDDLPMTPPAEDRRVHNPFHFSIVAPPRWDWRVTPPDSDAAAKYPTMALGPKKTFPRRCASIRIEKHAELSPDLSAYSPTSFQGLPGFSEVETRPGTLDDSPFFSYSLFFQRSGDWYRLGYVGLLHQEELPPMVQRYLETFRVESPVNQPP